MAAFFSKIIAFFTLILTLLGIRTGPVIVNTVPDIPETPVAETDENFTYKISDGVIDFSMISNPSTGYGWSYTLDGTSLVYKDSEFQNIDRGIQFSGAPGEQHYYFTVAGTGTTTIDFVYSRMFENSTAANEYNVTVTVADDMTVTVEMN